MGLDEMGGGLEVSREQNGYKIGIGGHDHGAGWLEMREQWRSEDI